MRLGAEILKQIQTHLRKVQIELDARARVLLVTELVGFIFGENIWFRGLGSGAAAAHEYIEGKGYGQHNPNHAGPTAGDHADTSESTEVPLPRHAL